MYQILGIRCTSMNPHRSHKDIKKTQSHSNGPRVSGLENTLDQKESKKEREDDRVATIESGTS